MQAKLSVVALSVVAAFALSACGQKAHRAGIHSSPGPAAGHAARPRPSGDFGIPATSSLGVLPGRGPRLIRGKGELQ